MKSHKKMNNKANGAASLLKQYLLFLKKVQFEYYESDSPWKKKPAMKADVIERPAQERVIETPAGLGLLETRTEDLFAESNETPPIIEEGIADKKEALLALEKKISTCHQCALSKGRTNVVPGAGNPEARLMFIGEGPGYHEDQQGIPFVGAAGQLLDKMIEAMGLSRAEVFVTNVVKCRPPNNRNPFSDEVDSCSFYLDRQIKIIKPEIICLLGKVAANSLLANEAPLYKMRGVWHEHRGIPLLVTYHPAYLLRNPNDKKKSWADLQEIMARLGLEDPRKKKKT